jgi:hypothetical protein
MKRVTIHLVDPNNPDYHSYLLRLWRDRAQDPWRASLQSTATEQLLQFASLEALFAFLIALLGDGAAGSGEIRST